MTGFFVRRVLGISTGFPSKPIIGGAAAEHSRLVMGKNRDGQRTAC
jgi:hypothetical protein